MNFRSRTFFDQVLKSKSIARILMNDSLAAITLKGEVLELGAGSEPASYHQFLKKNEPHQLTFSDYYHKDKNWLKLDLEKPFKLNRQFDQIICCNVLEHVYHHQNLLSESFKILKPGGEMVGVVPFLINYHPDPHDYFRYTKESLEKLAKEAGFQNAEINYLGLGPFLASYSNIQYLIPPLLRPLIIATTIGIDKLLLKFAPYYRDKFPLAYFFRLSKR